MLWLCLQRRRNYFDQTDGFVFVIDSSDRKRLQETADELAQLLQACNRPTCSIWDTLPALSSLNVMIVLVLRASYDL